MVAITALVFTKLVFTNEVAIVGTLYVMIKFAAYATAVRRPTGPALAAYLFWPGVDPRPFVAARPASTPSPVLRGALVMAAGLAAGVLLACAAPRLSRDAVGWLGVAVLLTTVHLGFSDVLSGWLGRRYPVRRLFADPLASRSLREFWSLRWNTAFVEMNRVVFRPLARRWCGRHANLALFGLSGLLHEAAISLPVLRGFGGPTAYFLLHAAAVRLEPRLRPDRWPRPLDRLWVWGWILVPLPLLFHTPFRDALVVPLFTAWRTR